MRTTNGKRGGNLVGKPHNDKSGNPIGGIKAQVTDAGGKPVELEGGEVIINKEASKKYWKELSKINQSAGNGVPIEKPIDPHDEDPSEYEEGGKIIEFNRNHLPNKWILSYAKSIKKDHPEIWKLGGNIYGNTAFENLSRVAERGYWLDSEEWMYKKWQSFLARHQHDFRIAGVVAVLKWGGKVNKGWAYMKNLIEDKIKKGSTKPKSMKVGGKVKNSVTQKEYLEYLTDLSLEMDIANHNLIEYLKSKGVSNIGLLPNEIKNDLKYKDLKRKFDAAKGKASPKVNPNLSASTDRMIRMAALQEYKKILANEIEKPKSMKDGGSIEFKPEKKGTLIKGSEIIKYAEKVNGNYRLMFYSIKESKGKVPILCDAFDYCKKIDVSNVSPNELIDLIEKNNLMEKGGKLIKRADGSYSKRGLWDNIRDNAGSGKKPTKQMLEQEAKIKAKSMKRGGVTGDIYSLKDREQFTQIMTIYNELSEKYAVKNYFIDNNSNSVVFIFDGRANEVQKKAIENYVSELKNKSFDIIDTNSIEWGVDKTSDYFKLKIKGSLKYADGGSVKNTNLPKVGNEVRARWNDSMQWTNGIFKGETENGFEVYDFSITKPKYIEYYGQISLDPYNGSEIFKSNKFKDRNYKNYHFNKEDENYADGGSIGFEDTLFNKLTQHNAPSFDVGGNVVTYKNKFNKKYGFDSDESHSLAEISKATKIKVSALQDIYDKGIGAYKTNPQSVRPNVKSKEQWAMARVYSAVMGGKAAKVDANELQRGKKYADGGLIAPNGNKSNLTPEQYKLVRTKAFKKWFGDWENDPKNASKVVDDNGEPLVVYHGSPYGEFNVFKNEVGIGDFWFTSEIELAKTHAIKSRWDRKDTIPYMVEAFLNIKNPTYGYTTNWKFDELKTNDGSVKVSTSFGNNVYVAYYPEQIKLADGSNTTFDGGNPDIRFKDGGEVKDEFANTKKLIDEIKKHSFYTKGTISTAKDGSKYRYDNYKLKYPNSANWLVQLFEKASEENTGKSYHTQFNHTDKYSFSFDRATFKGMPHGRMGFKELVLM